MTSRNIEGTRTVTKKFNESHLDGLQPASNHQVVAVDKTVPSQSSISYLHIIGLLAVASAVIMLTQLHVPRTILVDLNFTIIEKTNTQWPLRGAISTDTCRHRQCFGI